jgi:hypothetical protein
MIDDSDRAARSSFGFDMTDATATGNINIPSMDAGGWGGFFPLLPSFTIILFLVRIRRSDSGKKLPTARVENNCQERSIIKHRRAVLLYLGGFNCAAGSEKRERKEKEN